MEKYVNPIPDGGAPLHNNRINADLQTEFWDVIQGLFARYNSDTEGIILTGCVISGGGPYAMTAGIVYLNGEFMRIPAVASMTLPQYIQPDTVVNIAKTFGDGGSKTLLVNKPAKSASSIPGSGQYIAITTTTDPDDRRWKPAFQQLLDAEIALRNLQNPDGLLYKTIDIGDWNMDTTNSIVIPYSSYNIPHKKVRGIHIMIYIDVGVSGTEVSSLSNFDPSVNELTWYLEWDGSGNPVGLNILRRTSGDYDGTAYNATSYNRGKVTFIYAP